MSSRKFCIFVIISHFYETNIQDIVADYSLEIKIKLAYFNFVTQFRIDPYFKVHVIIRSYILRVIFGWINSFELKSLSIQKLAIRFSHSLKIGKFLENIINMALKSLGPS